ncbi:hypothetical protein TNCV_3804241 [Trichonephila clavipes]|nr:hypothetical protein TNCV_3804241 [Trichonephila clavipes]
MIFRYSHYGRCGSNITVPLYTRYLKCEVFSKIILDNKLSDMLVVLNGLLDRRAYSAFFFRGCIKRSDLCNSTFKFAASPSSYYRYLQQYDTFQAEKCACRITLTNTDAYHEQRQTLRTYSTLPCYHSIAVRFAIFLYDVIKLY